MPKCNACAGLAHLLEHMAFKGTPRIGSKDWKQEAPLLGALDEGGGVRAGRGAVKWLNHSALAAGVQQECVEGKDRPRH